MTQKPKVLFFDIETTPNLCFTWGLGKQWIGHENIYKERQVSVICWKWGGESKIHSMTFDLSKQCLENRDDQADLELLKRFSLVYNQADLAVGHNAVKFDIGSIRARLVKHRLPDIAPVLLDDTYLASLGLRFNSHKLDYLATYFTVGKKAPHDFSLWKKVATGCPDALHKMVVYCKQDVALLEKVYNRLKPYIKTKLNLAVFSDNERLCPSCGKYSLVSNGVRRTVSGNRLRLRCAVCGKHHTTGSTQIPKRRTFPR